MTNKEKAELTYIALQKRKRLREEGKIQADKFLSMKASNILNNIAIYRSRIRS